METDRAAQEFLGLERIAVAGVSRTNRASPANGIAKRLRDTGHTVFLVNPKGGEIDGHRCYPSVEAIEGGVEGVVVVTAPAQAKVVAEQAAKAGAAWIWFHQGMGPVSFDDVAIETAKQAGLRVIAFGCPMMYCEPDIFHRCMRGIFRFFGRIPKNVEP